MLNKENKAETLCSGLYIKGVIEGMPTLFTADTVASKTVISIRVFDKTGKGRSELRQSRCLNGACRTPIKELDKASFRIKLGCYEMTLEAILADIEDEALL
jgi:hypothetical protein